MLVITTIRRVVIIIHDTIFQPVVFCSLIWVLVTQTRALCVTSPRLQALGLPMCLA